MIFIYFSRISAQIREGKQTQIIDFSIDSGRTVRFWMNPGDKLPAAL